MNRNTDFIPFALPCLGPEEEEAVLRVMRSGWLTTGKETEAFEKEFAKEIGAGHAIAVNSATAGLHLSLEAFKLPAESWVITTPYTFTATAEIIRYRNAHPLFADIDEKTFNIDPDSVEKIIKRESGKKDIKGIIPVHVGGRSCEMERLCETAVRNGLFITEDAAHAFPSVYKNKSAGTWGNTGVFSFYATKTITTGEGGMVVTEDEETARVLRCLRLHGIDREVWDRYQSRKLASWEYDIAAAGFKYNPTDISSAMGRIQLKKAGSFLSERKKIARFYMKEFEEIPGIILPEDCPSHAWHLFIIQIDNKYISIDRNRFMELMAEEGIGTSVHYKPLHLMSYYSRKYGLKPDDFPNSLKVFNRCLSLPIYPGMTEEQIKRSAEGVKKIALAARIPEIKGCGYGPQ